MRPRSRHRIGFRHAVRGLRWAALAQGNLRIELAIGVAAVLLAAWLRAPLAPVLLASGLVICAELLNTAVEVTVDLVRPRRDPLAGRAKDVGAAAVLVAAGVSVAVGLVVLGPPLLARLGGGTV